MLLLLIGLVPGGGVYVWNEEYQTYESTEYGHPGRPRAGPGLPLPLQGVTLANMGVTFVNEGLRARVEVLRQK